MVALRQLAPLVVLSAFGIQTSMALHIRIGSAQATQFLGLLSAFLDPDPAWYPCLGQWKLLFHKSMPQLPFPFFATGSYTTLSPTCNWATEGCTTAVMMMATMLDQQTSSSSVLIGFLPTEQVLLVASPLPNHYMGLYCSGMLRQPHTSTYPRRHRYSVSIIESVYVGIAWTRNICYYKFLKISKTANL